MTSTLPKAGSTRAAAELEAELAQRSAQLAIVNEVGEALARGLDFQSVVDAVGDRVGQILGSRDLSIAIVEPAHNLITFPYWIENGIRDFDTPGIELGEGLTSQIISTGKPIRLGTSAEADARGALMYGEIHESYLGVPIRSGEQVLGVLSVSNRDPNVFSAADEQLLSTIASSMGVAIENARLFDQTKRLLGQTEQHAAELAIINDIGSALAEQLEFEKIVDLVGDRLVSMFKSPDFYIALVDHAAKLIRFPYELDRGRRVNGDPIEVGQGVSSRVLEERRPFRFGTLAEQTAHGGFIGT